ncbi:MAG: VCBS repeat-containing protein [Planctomycetes bacterium]|nr:VCBS repeat-containing protein [Planctomycetota bacterium]
MARLLRLARQSALTGAVAVLGTLAHAQVIFTNATSSFPNASIGYTENVDFGDVDGDGDLDAVLADGGDAGGEQNRIWINRGFEPGGTLGVFVDRTATQFPTLLDQSRDIEFVDLDNDGDLDIYVSNTSAISPQSNRWWINSGGGFYVDQTAAHWSGIGGPGSSVAPGQVLGSGGFIDFSCDCDFGDLDNDGDLDLLHTSYGGIFGGQVPTRLFLNTAGSFSEFNPSGYQLPAQTITNGVPGVWCQGTQAADTVNSTGLNCDIASSALDADLGDIDGDLDLDILHGARQEKPRMFRNLLETGALAFRDVTGAVFPANYSTGNGHYEQEMGDCDGDNDLDVYGLNWLQGGLTFNDITLTNNGSGVFANLQTLSGSNADDNEGDFFDYDNDGDLDLYIANFSGQDRLYRNNLSGAGFSHTNVTNQLPSNTAFSSQLDADCADLDDDGDTDVMVAVDAGGAEYYFRNTTNTADTFAPRCVNLEQAPNRSASVTPTVVRVQVYDNAPYYYTWYATVSLKYRVVPGAFVSVPMHASEGQIWRGVIPGTLVGTVEYQVVATDRHGNTGSSITKSFVAGCAAGATTYCTAGTTSSGCNASMAASGTPSATAASGFSVTTSNVEGQKNALFFYGTHGRAASVWAPGSSSFLCVKAPVQRMTSMNTGGTASACNGSLVIDWNSFMFTHPGALGQPLSAGQVINMQAWFRDPGAPATTNLSNGLEFIVCP